MPSADIREQSIEGPLWLFKTSLCRFLGETKLEYRNPKTETNSNDRSFTFNNV